MEMVTNIDGVLLGAMAASNVVAIYYQTLRQQLQI